MNPNEPFVEPVVSHSDLVSFMEASATKLRDHGEDDAAFYFEQVADYLSRNPMMGLTENVNKILGMQGEK
jgi:hypothetical protein